MLARRFRVHHAEHPLAKFAASDGLAPLPESVVEVVSLMVGFYAAKRPRGVAREEGDGLLWQWGIYDNSGIPEFTFDLTRQFIRAGVDGAISQLQMTACFSATDELAEFGRGEEWCFDYREAAAFVDRIRASRQYVATAVAAPVRVDSRYEQV